MRLLDLFAGIGGFSLAAHWMGWETVAFVERDKFCQKVLRKNFGQDIEIHDDICAFSGKPFQGAVDIITGGFPCQPFSAAGERKGKEDERHLWPEMLRTIREIQPSWVVGENVLGLVDWSRGMVFDEVQIDLEDEGYEVTPYLLPACAVNAPHKRERVFIIAHSNKIQRKPLGVRRTKDTQQRNEGKRRENWDEFELVDNGTVFTGWKYQRQRDCPEPLICRKSDGFSDWMDRYGALGNSIVPQIAYEIFRAIEAAENA